MRLRRPSPEQIYWHWCEERRLLAEFNRSVRLSRLAAREWTLGMRVGKLEFWLGLLGSYSNEAMKADRHDRKWWDREARKIVRLVRKEHRRWLREDRVGLGSRW